MIFFGSFISAHPTNSNSPYDDWRMFGHDTGFTRFTNSNAPANISNTVAITKSFAGDADTAPVVIWDSLYYFPYSGDYSASYAYKLNASNISQVLANSTNTYAIKYSPTYYKENLFVQQDYYLYQVNVSNLSQVIDSEYIADSAGWYQIPVVFSDSVWTGSGNYNPYVRQFNASNISRAIASYYVYDRPYEQIPIVGDYAYFSFSSGLYQANSSNISQVFRSTTCLANSIEGAPSVGYGSVYKACTVGSIDYLFQFNASNISQRIANFSRKGWFYGLGNGFVYFSNGTNFFQLNASNISQEIANYTFHTPSWYAIPAITSEYVFVSAGSIMYQLNASNVSQRIGNYSASSTIGGAPVISKGFLFFGSVDDKLYQLGVYNPLPALKIDYPGDEKIYASITELNYSLMQNSTHVWDKCWYSNNSGATNFSIQNAGEDFTGLSLPSGSHHLTVFCNDSNGVVYSEYSSSFLDTDFPTFTGVSNKTINQTSSLSHQINATDIGGVMCFAVNDSVNFSISCSGLLTNKTFLDVGNYSLNVSVYDYADHYNYTTIVVAVLDSVSPSLRIISPVNNTNTSDSGLDVNYTVSDFGTAVNSCWYSNDSFSVNYSLSGCSNITNVVWSEGVHNIKLWANDSVGNVNTTTLRFTVDTVSPIFNNLTNQSVTQGNIFSYQLNATDSTLRVSCYQVNDTTNFNVNCTGYLTNNTVLSDGIYSLNVSVNDSVGNLNWSMFFINVTTRPVIFVSIISPSGNINATQNQTFSVTANVSCFNTDCGEVNVTLDPISGTGLNYSMYNSSESGADSYSWEEIISNGIGTSIWNNTNLDEGSSTLALPFNFSFYGINYSRIYVVVNGRVDFTSDYTGSYSMTLPHSGLKSIAAANQDLMLYSASGGKVFYANRTGPNRVVIQYYNVSTYGASATRYTFQIILYSDGKIKIQYNNMSTAYSQDDNNGLNFNSTNHLLIGADAPDQYTGKAVTFYPAGYAIGNGKGGVVSMNTSATPFYTTTQNPYNITLNRDQSQLITWIVNATGANNSYEFFVYANKTSDLSIGNTSSRWNVTITLTPSCNSVYQNTSWNGWQNQTSCRVNNTILQNRSLVQYDDACGSANVTFWNYQEIVCDFCTPSLANSSWSDWSNLSCANNLINQSRNLVQYDGNFCGEIENITFYEYQSVFDCSVNLNIISPLNTTYNNRTQLLNISSDGVSVWYNWNGTNVSYSSPLSILFSEGVNTLRAYSNNSFSAITSLIRVFTTDTIAPNVSIISPQNVSYNTTRVLLNVSSDAENIWYNWNGTNISYSSSRYIYFSSGSMNLSVYVNDSMGNMNYTNVTFFCYLDEDFDEVRDGEDNLTGNVSNINMQGISIPNLTIDGNSSANSFNGEAVVVLYDSVTPVVNFTHNFSSSNLNLSKITVVKTENSLIVNLSGQLQEDYNKTIYIEDNNFVSLCVKDDDVSSVSEVSSGCNGENETLMTSCLGGNYTANGIGCFDEGSVIRIENLRHSAVVGVPETVTSAEEVPIHSGSGGGSYIREQKSDNNSLLLRLFISPNKTVFTKIKNYNSTGLKEIELKTKNWLTGEVYVVAYNETPDFCSIDYDGKHKVYRVLEFKDSFNNASIESGRFRVGVEKDWIYNNNISEIKFVRCYPEYEEVRSSFEEETESEGIYDVYISGFSAYAIFGVFDEGESGNEKVWVDVDDVDFNVVILWLVIVFLLVVIVFLIAKHGVKISEHFRSKWLKLDIRLKVGR